MTTRTIAIVGAGFSGVALAVNLVRQTGPGTRIVLVERASQFGLGQAYSTTNPGHLLNVQASRMSAFSDQPDHFMAWLQRRPGAPHADGFMPRKLFGAYVRDLLDQTRREAGGRLQLVRGDVVGVTEGGLDAPEMTVALAGGREIPADIAVLAVGNFEPRSVLPGDASSSPNYYGNPWLTGAAADLDPDAPVLLIGTGLTMVDTVITLLDAGHRGPIHALSRRGLVPHRHVARFSGSGPAAPDYPIDPTALLRCLRADAEACIAAGGAWQHALDRFRHSAQAAWLAASPPDRARFLRHLRPWWDVHRHRIASPVADRIDAARARSQLRIVAGRIRGTVQHDGALEVEYARRGSGALASIRAARVINCTGPASDYARLADPLVHRLLQDGLARPDELRLGLDVTRHCAVVGADGTASETLFAAGPVTRGTFWESTAVPDIREQCEDLASHIAGVLRADRTDGAFPAGLVLQSAVAPHAL